jgi:16S rRNA (uracil1498-N3)-methyltransferase
MTRRRFYAPPEAFSVDRKSATLNAEETRHLRNVLRLKPGAEIYVFDGKGREFRCQIQTIARDATAVEVIEQVVAAQPESSLNLTLAVAFLKGEKFDLVIQKATELGVTRIVPVIASRADVKASGGKDSERKTVRWQRIALEATKQCGRAALTTIERPATFEKLIESSNKNSLMFAEREGNSLATALDEIRMSDANMTALVGPEGGWNEDEIDQARNAGWQIVTLGGRILRAETAAIVIATLLQNYLGDLK